MGDLFTSKLSFISDDGLWVPGQRPAGANRELSGCLREVLVVLNAGTVRLIETKER